MLKFTMNSLLKILIFFTLISFVFTFEELNCIGFLLYFTMFLLVFGYEIFSYNIIKKRFLNYAIFRKNSKIKPFLSGNLSHSVSSFIKALFFTTILIINFSNINNYIFLYIFIALPLIFIITKFIVMKKLMREFRMANYSLKKVIIYISSTVSTIVFMIFFINFMLYKNVNLSEIFILKTINTQCVLINEILAVNSFIENIQNFLYTTIQKQFAKIIVLIIFSFNYFVFFIAIMHIYSFLFTKKDKKNSFKFGYFLQTIFVLAFGVLIFFLTSFLNQNYENKLQSEQIILNLKNKINIAISQNLMNTKNAIDIYIDQIYELSIDKAVKNIADFEYAWYSDYVKLYHGAIDKNASIFYKNKFDDIIKSSFPVNLNDDITNIILLNLDNLKKDISNIANENAIKYDTTKIISIIDMQSYELKFGINSVLTLGGITALKTGAKLAAKSGAKLALKSSTSLSAGTSGALCGPASIVCVPLLAITTWFGFDYVISKAYESLNREEFETELKAELMNQKENFKALLYQNIDRLYFKFI